MERAGLICDRRGELPALVGHYADDLPNVIEDVDHKPGTCRPSCSPECYRAKVRSLAFTLPASFLATR